MPEGEESIANFVQRGEIRVGGLRMCLFEITGGFFSIRESLEKSIGPAASTILYQAGVRSGKRFVASASRIGMIRTGRQGLTDCIDVFSQAGFGNFSIVDFDWEIPQMVIECCNPTAFEAYAYQENKSSPIVPVCDYTRGVLAGFIQHLINREDILCVETACKATGSTRCIFRIGLHDEMMRIAIISRSRI